MKILYMKTIMEKDNLIFELDSDTKVNYNPRIDIILTNGEEDFIFSTSSNTEAEKIFFTINIKEIKKDLKENFIIKYPVKIKIFTEEETKIITINKGDDNKDPIIKNFNDALNGKEISYSYYNMRPSTMLSSIDRDWYYNDSFCDFNNAFSYKINVKEFPNVLNPTIIEKNNLDTTLGSLSIEDTGKVYIIKEEQNNTKIAIPIIKENERYWIRLSYAQIYDNGPKDFKTLTSIRHNKNMKYLTDYKIKINNKISRKPSITSSYFKTEDISEFIQERDLNFYFGTFSMYTASSVFIYNDINTDVSNKNYPPYV